MARASEVEYAALLVSWLEGCGWDVYQEVEGIDVVAVRGRVSWAIEVKVSASWRLLAQCLERRRRAVAHMVSAACPLPRSRDDQGAVVTAYEALGVGLIRLNLDSGTAGGEFGRYGLRDVPVRELVRPALDRRLLRDVRRHLRPEHKTHTPAGTPSGSGWTRYKATCCALLEYAESHPGVLLADAVAEIEHHYSSQTSAVSTLASRIRDGLVPGVRVTLERLGRRERLVVYAVSAGR